MSTTSSATDDHAMRRELSRRIVALFKDYVGRGPTHARSYVHDDLVVVLLHDTLTRAEQSLAEADRTQLVRDVRRSFQGTLREHAVAIIEEVTGRKVIAFMSDHAIEPDYAIEAFVLDSSSGEPPPADV